MSQILNQNLKDFLTNIIEQKKSKSISSFISDLLGFAPKNLNMTKTPDTLPSPFIFSQADSGLWYNWATSVGRDLIAISYSAGTTYIFNNSEPLTSPQIKIFYKDQISDTNTSEPLAQITLEGVQGIRSLLLVNNCGIVY